MEMILKQFLLVFYFKYSLLLFINAVQFYFIETIHDHGEIFLISDQVLLQEQRYIYVTAIIQIKFEHK